MIREGSMRGADRTGGALLSYVAVETRIAAKQRRLTNAVLAELDGAFSALYEACGRPSIPPERPLRATRLQLLYTSIRSARSGNWSSGLSSRCCFAGLLSLRSTRWSSTRRVSGAGLRTPCLRSTEEEATVFRNVERVWALLQPRSPTHKSHPNSGGSKFDECEVVGVMFFEACRDGKDLAGAEPIQHVRSAPIARLALRQLQRNGQAIGIDEHMDFGCQPAPRAPHAPASIDVPSGGRGFAQPPFLPLAPC